VGEVYGVLHDVTLRLQIGVDIEGCIGDEQRSRVSRNIHYKDMAHATSSAKANANARSYHSVHQLIGM
jgi:hypothetical protein